MEQTIEKIATADHGHGIGHHEEHHHVETFINKYIFSQDHKMIARQFLFTGMIWAIIGGLFSVLFRVQLGWPDATFPALEQLFGNWFTVSYNARYYNGFLCIDSWFKWNIC